MSDEFKLIYPTTPNLELTQKYNCSKATIIRAARLSGLKKDFDYIRKIHREKSLGHKLSPEACAKIAEKAKGRIVSEETKLKIIETKRKNGSIPRGKNHYRWKGGKPWLRFKNPLYIIWRNLVLERDNYVCQICNRKCNKNEKGLAAHHILPYAIHIKLRYEINNGQTLCRECHMSLHGKSISVKYNPCSCGCGILIASHDRYGRPRKYVNFHGKRGKLKNKIKES